MLEPSITLQRRLNREEEVIALLEGALSVQERMRDLDMVARVSRKVIELQECAVVQNSSRRKERRSDIHDARAGWPVVSTRSR
ncbi:hypothetical protein sscle_02g015340 [Sclerotinia sclerotiorum 1980 UF-70]|uniref:Uncharacterized protein n=1 Tax=Sclerotinia sclerotiorum (strain ATCC 18683 / 1980 / Ss-1) TaxID=665079 RepID=A0A1D9PVM9_SCLS1|nr:hypothetical protein sscle_02g015340 [Sclerotinia sclerotiorum 1980 UF-70]